LQIITLTALCFATVFIFPNFAGAQSQQQDYQVIQSDRSETFSFPYSASNRPADDPLVYAYDEPKSTSWILTISNNVSYVPREDAKTIVRIQEPTPSEKYVEIAMFGGESMRYWVAVNRPESGYERLHANDRDGWSTENAISLWYNPNSGLSVTDGRRIVLDRFDMDGFTVSSIAVYGRDNATSLDNAYQGKITFELLFGNIQDSPIYLVPAAVMAGVGGVVFALLMLKKRKPSD
jgi:hypothetical protein